MSQQDYIRNQAIYLLERDEAVLLNSPLDASFINEWTARRLGMTVVPNFVTSFAAVVRVIDGYRWSSSRDDNRANHRVIIHLPSRTVYGYSTNLNIAILRALWQVI